MLAAVDLTVLTLFVLCSTQLLERSKTRFRSGGKSSSQK
jgi:hypothetical protein